MCGIVGAVLQPQSQQNVSPILLEALTTLQHRGQDAAGIATSDGPMMNVHKSNGVVADVFKEQRTFQRLLGPFGIGHNRYPTAGTSNQDEAQPFYSNAPYGLAFAHNGNLTNTAELRRYCRIKARRQINTGSDSELMLAIFSDELYRHEKQVDASTKTSSGSFDDIYYADDVETPHPSHEAVFAAVSKCMNICKGAFAGVVLINGLGVVGFRDPHGIRPLSFGVRDTPRGPEGMIASESVPIDICGFQFCRDVKPGEAILFDARTGEYVTQMCAQNPVDIPCPCIFEYVYFARQDSVIDGASVYEARVHMGQLLGERIKKLYPNEVIDAVIPVPATSRVSAVQCAVTLGVPYVEGLVRNRYTQRTFIMPGQKKRKKSVRLKLNPVTSVIKGRSVLLVDDSIVRGTTSRHIIHMVRQAGAKKVFFASAAPAIRHPNVYGIDMPTREELIAYNRTEEEVAQALGADWVIYQSIDDLRKAVQATNSMLQSFDMSCFDGIYIAGDLPDNYFQSLHQERCDSAKEERDKDDRLKDAFDIMIDSGEAAAGVAPLGDMIRPPSPYIPRPLSATPSPVNHLANHSSSYSASSTFSDLSPRYTSGPERKGSFVADDTDEGSDDASNRNERQFLPPNITTHLSKPYETNHHHHSQKSSSISNSNEHMSSEHDYNSLKNQSSNHSVLKHATEGNNQDDVGTPKRVTIRLPESNETVPTGKVTNNHENTSSNSINTNSKGSIRNTPSSSSITDYN